MSTAKAPITPVEFLHRKLDVETLDILETLSGKGFTLEAEESEFRFHVKGTPVGELLCDPEEVAAAARAYHGGEIAVPVMPEPDREAHEADLKQRLISLLGANGVTAEEGGRGGVIAGKRAVFTFRCGADAQTVYDAEDEAIRARVASNPSAESYVLLCCVPVKAYDAINKFAERSTVRFGEWDEDDAFPFQMADLLPPLAETLLAQIARIDTLPDFQAFLKDNDMQAVFKGELDAQKRFTLVEWDALQRALEECAVRLGMTVNREPDDATDDPLANLGKLVHPQTSEAEDVGGELENERDIIPNSIPQGEIEIGGHVDPSAPYLTWLRVEAIDADGGTQSRVAGLNRKKVDEYKERQADGQQAPPVVVFFDGKTYWLGDGFHRYAATVERQQSVIRAEVREGTRDDAIFWNIRANSDHGVAYTPADKHHAVELLINNPKWSRMPNREMARVCGVTHTFVGNVRERLTGSRTPQEVVVQRGESSYTLNTANIGTNQKASAEDDIDLAPDVAALSPDERSRAFDNFVEAHRSPAEAPPEAQEDSHDRPEAPNAAATAETSLTKSPPTASAGDTTLAALVAALRAAGLNGLSRDELLERGFSHALIEQAKQESHAAAHVNGRLLYNWKPADVVAAIRDHGSPLSRLELEDLGCQSYAINIAKADGLIQVADDGKLEIAADKAATPVATTQAALTATPKAQKSKPDPRAAIEGRLTGRALVVTHTFMPKGLGVQITVNLSGAEPADALNSKLYPAERMWRGMGDEELEIIHQRLDAELAKLKPKPKAPARSKPATPKKKPAKGKVNPLDPANFKKGSKVRISYAGKEAEAVVVGVSSKDKRKLRLKVRDTIIEEFPAQLLPVKSGSKKSAAKKGK